MMKSYKKDVEERRKEARAWLHATFYVAESGSVTKAEVYAAYLCFCHKYRREPFNRAVFGRQVVRKVFPMLQSRRQGGRGNVKYHYMQLQFRNLADRPPLSMWQNVKESSTDGDGDHPGGEREREQEDQEETRKRKWNEGGTMIREKLPSPKRLQLLIPRPRERREDEEEEGEEIEEEEEQLRREEVYYPPQSQQPRDDDIPPNTDDDKGMKLTLLLPPPPLPPSPYFMMTLPFFQSSSFTSSSSSAFPSNLSSPFSSSSSNSALWRELLQDNSRTFRLNSLEGSSSGASFPSFGSFNSLGSSPPLPDVHSPALASAAGPFYFTSLYAIPPVTAITNNPNYNRDNHNNHNRDSNPTRDNPHDNNHNNHNRDHTDKESNNNNNQHNNRNNHNSTLVRPPRPTMGLEDRLLELKQERAQERQVYPLLSSISEMTWANLNFDSLLRVLEIQAEETS